MNRGPLRGRTVLVAGSEDTVPKLVASLQESGAIAIPFPAVRIVPPRRTGPLDEAIRTWRAYDWVVFTSAHGVEAVVSRARMLRLDLADSVNVAAVGPATKTAAEAAGLAVRAIPEEYLTDRIADALGDVRDRRILLARSALAGGSLAKVLRARGANVREVEAYDAVPASPDLAAVRALQRIDFIALTSASAARNLVTLLDAHDLKRLRSIAEAACIGPVTAEAARELGFRVAAVADVHTIPGLVARLQEAIAHG